MYTATKKITRVGSYSKGVVIPRDWLLLMRNPEQFNMEFDDRSQVITITPLRGGAVNHGQNASSDYTPQPRRQFATSPHPAYTAKKWSELEPWFQEDRLRWMKEAEEAGVDITSAAELKRYEQNTIDMNARKAYTPRGEVFTFEDIPDATRNYYINDVEPLLYFKSPINSDNARKAWMLAYNSAIMGRKEDYAKTLEACRTKLINIYGKHKVTFEDLEDEL